jgi:hypothetical protein
MIAVALVFVSMLHGHLKRTLRSFLSGCLRSPPRP